MNDYERRVVESVHAYARKVVRHRRDRTLNILDSLRKDGYPRNAIREAEFWIDSFANAILEDFDR